MKILTFKAISKNPRQRSERSVDLGIDCVLNHHIFDGTQILIYVGQEKGPAVINRYQEI